MRQPLLHFIYRLVDKVDGHQGTGQAVEAHRPAIIVVVEQFFYCQAPFLLLFQQAVHPRLFDDIQVALGSPTLWVCSPTSPGIPVTGIFFTLYAGGVAFLHHTASVDAAPRVLLTQAASQAAAWCLRLVFGTQPAEYPAGAG